MVEYHVDVCKHFHTLMKDSKYGGNLSKFFPQGKKAIILLGHDECIFKQFQFTNKGWVSDEGVREILPKDKGMGVMISAFQSREFGFGMELSSEQLQQVNKKRNGEDYIDKSAAVLKRGTSQKQPLTSSPFYIEFEYGAQKEGYWTYDHFVLQCEDVADCLDVIYPEFEFRFCVDHSCGHDRQQSDGLNARKMNKLFGGKQPHLHDTTIIEDDGFFGPYRRQLMFGDEQHFTFQKNDEGPFWLKGEEKENRRWDRYTGKKKTKVLSVRELMTEIHSNMPALAIKDLRNKNKSDIERLATGLVIALRYEYNEVKDRGWEGQPKGLLQILWERGWIEEDNQNVNKYYTMGGSKDRYGNVIANTSLPAFMEACYDFLNEKTLLQEIMSQRGIVVLRSPKCHSELAGEGIEYSWGYAKNWYRRLSLKLKRGKDKFHGSVRETMSTNVLTTQIVRRFARRARGYTCAYYSLAFGDDQFNTGEKMSPEVIERLVMEFKTHRSALGFDGKYIKQEDKAVSL